MYPGHKLSEGALPRRPAQFQAPRLTGTLLGGEEPGGPCGSELWGPLGRDVSLSLSLVDMHPYPGGWAHLPQAPGPVVLPHGKLCDLYTAPPARLGGAATVSHVPPVLSRMPYRGSGGRAEADMFWPPTGRPAEVGRWRLSRGALVGSEGDVSLPTLFPLPEASRPLAWSICKVDRPDLPASLGAPWVRGARTRPGCADQRVTAGTVPSG